MKKLLVLVLMLGLLPVTSGFAQTTKGNTLLGVSSQFSLLPLEEGISMSGLLGIGFGNFKVKSDGGEENDNETKLRSFNSSPRLGFFVVDNLALGADLNFSSVKMKNSFDEYEYEGESENTMSLFGFGPFARFYFPTGKMFPFIEAGALFGQVKNKYKWESNWGDGEEEEKIGVSGFNAGAGVGFPLGEKAVLDLALGYQSMAFKGKEDNPDNERTIVGTFGLKVGIVVILGKK
ncbi:MAG: outer membrane beta-barrel protein [Bacteroides sp.]|jgi:outer membrane protein|nr:outer membrane beta-barrel protein [Bacteroides sp.]